jgi:hydrogenase/urease accessory protein HupE
MTGWAVAKYALALAGVALVLLADRVGVHWLSFVGLALIVVAFLLRFPQRRLASRDT